MNSRLIMLALGIVVAWILAFNTGNSLAYGLAYLTSGVLLFSYLWAVNGVRRILEADLWEISVVTFPMLPGARIETVKGRRTCSLPTPKEFEIWLRRDAGLSRNEARAVMTKGFESLVRKVDVAPGSSQDLAARIRDFTRIINKRGLTI